MTRHFLSVMLMALAGLGLGCGSASDGRQRTVLYSTSPGFVPVEDRPAPVVPTPSESPTTPENPGEVETPEEVPGEPEAPTDSPEDPETPTDDPETPSDPEEEGPIEAPLPAGADAFADRVVSHQIGSGGGLNEEDLPGIVLGAPRGFGLFQGSFHVLSLGVGGEIVLEMADYAIFDGAGDDFTVFENAFEVSGGGGVTFAEPGIVGVSEDGVTFVDFPCALSAPYAGCAGVTPVLANADLNDIDPTDPTVSGGDTFDLRDVGLKTARFVRIRDSGLGLGPIGPDTRGFDLDAIAIIHGTLPQ